jgi:hypothetical protein
MKATPFNPQISNSEITSCGTMPPRLFAVTRSLPRSWEFGSTSWCCPVRMVAGGRRSFRRVPRSWPSKTSVLRLFAARVKRSASSFFFFFSRCRSSTPEREMSKRIAAVAMSSRIGETFDAIVTGVTSRGTFVRVLKPAVEGLLAQGQQGADLGDKLHVKLTRTDIQRD